MPEQGHFYRCDECHQLTADPLVAIIVSHYVPDWSGWADEEIRVCSTCKWNAEENTAGELAETANMGTD